MSEPFLVSTSVVALAEVGDKTQLLSLVLAAQYRKPGAVILGVAVATLLSHASAGGVGMLLSSVLSPTVLNWAVVASFLLMARWILLPDAADGGEMRSAEGRFGVVVATAGAFFLAELGDKTQVATIALAAEFHDVVAVVAGTTLGMLIANVPVVLLGNRFAERLPAARVRRLAALLFVILGGLALRTALNGG
jgi:putative Ca2+/H+ antiporter (TMEM165/GDT1 family)